MASSVKPVGLEMLTDWGTGDIHGQVAPVNQQVSKHPSWHYSGQPKEQYYELTKLKLSNVRSNDQLLPESHKSDMGAIAINKSFPAEHPYSSHISRRAVFPKFDSSEDPKRGLAARGTLPMNVEMPANAHDITIVSKTKGFGLRHEQQSNPRSNNKTPLHWLGEDGFDQVTKSHGERQQFYPTPIKTLTPNLQQRTAEHTLTDRSANTLRNVERHQWLSSYNLSHTGLGDASPITLDNYDQKKSSERLTGDCDNKLYPSISKAFMPPRPHDGRISRGLKPPSRGRSPAPVNGERPTRKSTPREVSQERLLHGKPYLNLPENFEIYPNNEVPENLDSHLRDGNDHDSNCSRKVAKYNNKTEVTWRDQMMEERDNNAQEIEAQNRWKALELETPEHDIEQLKIKYGHLITKDHPETFYNHEGRYNEERSGLYKTSYNPSALAHSMNSGEGSGLPSEKVNQSLRSAHPAVFPDGHERDWLNYSLNMGSERIGNDGVFRPLKNLKETQIQMLQPSYENSQAAIQEGEFIPSESTKNSDYDTPKFLQTNTMPDKCMASPSVIMSHENQNLNNTRLASHGRREKPLKKSVKFADNIKEEFNPVFNQSARAFQNAVTYHDPIESSNNNKENFLTTSNAFPRNSDDKYQTRDKKPVTTNGTSRDEFISLSTNFVPTGMKTASSKETAYQKQFPVYTRQQLALHDDARFGWEPGYGQPRPQTTLLIQQANFNKSQIHKTFHEMFVETNPDLRDNICLGKKHSFCGMNAQDIHG